MTELLEPFDLLCPVLRCGFSMKRNDRQVLSAECLPESSTKFPPEQRAVRNLSGDLPLGIHTFGR